jgi:hypothetical protein
MLKNILNIKGAQKLTNEQQKSIQGGILGRQYRCDGRCLPNCTGGCPE